MQVGKLEPNPGPLNVVKLVILILMTASKTQDCEIRQGEKKSTQASL